MGPRSVGVAWPQSSLDQKVWGMGVEEAQVPASLSLAPWWAAVLE